ncbi:MAG: FAS1-like dehydratase domain-containing protein [Promethearchaeota archaeon]
MIDRKFIGHVFPEREMIIKRWKVSQFANAIRDDNPLYYDVNYAKSKGHEDLLVPPTFYTTMTFSDPNFFQIVNIDFRKLLDGGREIIYHSPCYANDTILYQTRIESIEEKEGKRGKMDVLKVITEGKKKETKEKVFTLIITLIVFH